MSVRAKSLNIGLLDVQYLLLLGSEASWIYPWTITAAMWIGGQRSPVMAFPTLVALLVLSVVAARLLATGGRPSFWRRWLLVLMGLAASCLAAASQLPVLENWGQDTQTWVRLLNGDAGGRAALEGIVAVFLWWRGLGLGRARPTLSIVEEEFRVGITALASLTVVSALAGEVSPLHADLLVLSTLGLVSSGLVGMPLARIVDVSRLQRHRDAPALAPLGAWLWMLLTVVGGILLITLLLSLLMTFDRITAIVGALAEPVGAVLTTAVYLLAMPIEWLVRGLIFLIRLLIPQGTAKPRAQGNDLSWMDQLQQGGGVSLSPEAMLALKIIVVVALVLGFLWLLMRAILRLQGLWEQEEVEEDRDFVWRWPGWRALWDWLLARRPRSKPAAAVALSPSNGRGAGPSVRQIYREFLSLGQEMGRARKPAETPLEYQRRLQSELSEPGDEEVHLITDSYLVARYAPPAPSKPDLSPMASALARLRALWQGPPPQ